MIFKNEHTPSLIPKSFFMLSIMMAILLAAHLMFTEVNNMALYLQPYAVEGNIVRQLILITCLLIYVIRLFLTNFVFLKRKMNWRETLVITTVMSIALFSFGRVGGSSELGINIFDYLGILLYVIGSWINTYSEFTRNEWKKDERNKGKVYTEGLFKYSIHINYFGDLLLFTGLASITQSFSLFIVPLAMTLVFIFFIIPRHDKYLGEKYGNDFLEYASNTKKLIPWIY
jgi:protein-S-isoprenylcysteine O-methyltransferase Ste14